MSTDRHTGDDAGLPDALGDVMLRDAMPLQPEDLCSTIARPYCEARANCCSSIDEDSIPDCINDFLGNCSDSLGRYVLDARLGYDAVAAQDVLDRFRAAADDASCNVDDVLQLFAYDLLGVLGGSVPAESLCTPTLEDPFPALSCQDSVCLSMGNPFFGQWRCGAAQGVGGYCVTYLECQRNLRCIPLSMCAAQLGDGESCRSAQDCESLFCRIDEGAEVGACDTPTQDDVFCAPVPEFPEVETPRDG